MTDHQGVREKDAAKIAAWTSRAEYGSDLIVDLFKAYEIEYAALNPGATFRGAARFARQLWEQHDAPDHPLQP